MGGYGSGYRDLTRKNEITLDDCRFLDINMLVRAGAVEDRVIQSGTWCWRARQTGQVLSSMRYETNTFDDKDLYLRISYNVKGTGTCMDYKIKLLKTYPPYGNVRFWFECPVTRKRVAKLYFLPDSDGFYLSRHASKLYYASQVRGKMDRALARKWKTIDKVDGNCWPIRPKGMHEKTFQRIIKKFLIESGNCQKMICKAFDLQCH